MKQKATELWLHIGTEKTGSTSIQHFLATNRRRLRRQSVLVPKTPGRLSHHRVAAYGAHESAWGDLAVPARLTSNASRRRFRRKFPAVLRREIGRGGCQRVILSSEHCHSRVRTKPEIERLRALLEPMAERVRILVYFRRQDQMAVSAYTSDLKFGAVMPSLHSFLDSIDASHHRFDLHGVYERWAAVFGADRVVARIFDPEKLYQGDLIEDFATCTGIQLSSRFVRPQRRNPGLDSRAVEFLRDFNRRFPRIVRERIDPRHSDVVRVLEERYPGAHLPSRDTARRLLRRFGDSNERLRRSLQLDRLFDDDFSAYPEQASESSLDDDRTAEIAAKIWKEVGRRQRRRSFSGRLRSAVREPSRVLAWAKRAL